MSLMIEFMPNSKQCEFGATFARSMLSWNHFWKFCFNKRWFCLLYCFWYDTYQQLYVADKARKYITQLLMWTILELTCGKKFDQTFHYLSCRIHFISDICASINHSIIWENTLWNSWILCMLSKNLMTFSFYIKLRIYLGLLYYPNSAFYRGIYETGPSLVFHV